MVYDILLTIYELRLVGWISARHFEFEVLKFPYGSLLPLVCADYVITPLHLLCVFGVWHSADRSQFIYEYDWSAECQPDILINILWFLTATGLCWPCHYSLTPFVCVWCMAFCWPVTIHIWIRLVSRMSARYFDKYLVFPHCHWFVLTMSLLPFTFCVCLVYDILLTGHNSYMNTTGQQNVSQIFW